MSGYDAPFAGLKVIDLSQGLAGPYCATLLAQHGADVIKVEPPGGDWSRILGPVYGDHTAFSIAGTLGKRSVVLDLKSDDGREVMWRLLRGADVLIEGFRTGVIGRLGFGWDAVSAREPGILMLSVSGFGPEGPLAERPAMDPVLQAYTGLTLENGGGGGNPQRVPFSVVDVATGLYAFQALSAALYARRNQSRGRHLCVSLLQGAASMQTVKLVGAVYPDATLPTNIPPSGAHRTADGWMTVQITTDREFAQLCTALGAPQLVDDPRFVDRPSRLARSEELYAAVRPLFAAYTSAELEARFVPARVMHERLNDYRTFLEQPHVRETGTVAWLPQPGLPFEVPMPNVPGLPPLEPGSGRAHAARLGEHTREVLAELGYAAGDVDALIARGVVAAAAP